MKMDDPFGRISQREESSYASFREAMIKSGVTDRASTDKCSRGITANGIRLTAIILIILGAALILLPQVRPISITMALLALLWVGVSVFNGRKFLRRYVSEELSRQ